MIKSRGGGLTNAFIAPRPGAHVSAHDAFILLWAEAVVLLLLCAYYKYNRKLFTVAFKVWRDKTCCRFSDFIWTYVWKNVGVLHKNNLHFKCKYRKKNNFLSFELSWNKCIFYQNDCDAFYLMFKAFDPGSESSRIGSKNEIDIVRKVRVCQITKEHNMNRYYFQVIYAL